MEGPKQRAAVEALREILTGHLGTLIVSGGVGTGKTHLAAVAVHEWERASRGAPGSAQYVTADRLVREIKISWQQGTAEQAVLDRYGDCGILVLDELGVGFGSNTETHYLSWTVARRYDLERP